MVKVLSENSFTHQKGLLIKLVSKSNISDNDPRRGLLVSSILAYLQVNSRCIERKMLANPGYEHDKFHHFVILITFTLYQTI